LRVESAFGTALDLAARSDTVTASMPGERLAFEGVGPETTSRLGGPGAIGFRIWSGAWDPPARAWRETVARDSLLALHWTEGPDSLVMTVGRAGLPVEVAAAPGSGHGARVRYRGWTHVDGVAWPSLLEIEIDAGRGSGTA